MGKTEPIKYASWLRDLTKELQEPFARDSEEMVGYFREFQGVLPTEYKWRMTDVEGFQSKIAQTSSPDTVNQIYWEDVARNYEAWAIMNIWRGGEILDGGISSLNKGHYLSSAVLARALLEIAAVMITEANNLLATIEKLPRPQKNQLVMVEGLEEIVLKLIWGSRKSDTPDYLTKKNSITYLKKLSKNPKASDLYAVYEYLCEAAHPNVVGYARFQSSEGIRNVNDIIIHMASDLEIGKSQVGNKLLEQTLWAFGWSAGCIRNAFHVVQKSIENINKLFPFRSKTTAIVTPLIKIGRNMPCPCGNGKKFKHCHGK